MSRGSWFDGHGSWFDDSMVVGRSMMVMGSMVLVLVLGLQCGVFNDLDFFSFFAIFCSCSWI